MSAIYTDCLKLSLLFGFSLFVVCSGQTAGELLVQPTVISSDNGVLDTQLTLDYTNYVGAMHSMQNARLFNGQLPGPTLRFEAGDVLRITFINNLEEQPNTVTTGNSFKNPDTR